MKVLGITSHRKETTTGVDIQLEAEATVQAGAAHYPITIRTKPYTVPFVEELERIDNKVEENEDEEFWDFRRVLMEMGSQDLTDFPLTRPT